MENRKNLCAMIPVELHTRVRREQEEMAMKLSEYVEMIIKEHFEKGEKVMANGTRTLAFQVSEELFGRIKSHLVKTGMSQKEFVIGLIEQALAADMTDNSDKEVATSDWENSKQNE